MAAPVTFVDTSILCNLLPVPGRDQHRDAVAAELLTKQRSGEVLVLAGQAPWQVHQFPWDADFLRRFLAGAGTGCTMIEHAVSGVGGGDVCILAERDAYRRRTGIQNVSIWTRDTGLGAYA